MSGSSLTLAKAVVEKLFREPQASKAAFIEGAATARSKKPADVV
jgi:hypothetical protein